MDPQTPNNLDPKLQATYDKVMGTPTSPQANTPQAAPAAAPTPPPPPAPATAAPDQSTPATPPADPAQTAAPSIPQTPYTADNLSFQAAIQPPDANQMPLGGVVAPRQPSSLLKILYIIGGVVFFVVYTFVWIKIFNIPLPF